MFHCLTIYDLSLNALIRISHKTGSTMKYIKTHKELAYLHLEFQIAIAGTLLV